MIEATSIVVEVLRDNFDCTLNGVTSRYDRFMLVWGEHPTNCFLPVLRLVKWNIMGRESLHASPVDEAGEVIPSGMMGGNFVYTCDSRFPAQYPIPVHDRFEP